MHVWIIVIHYYMVCLITVSVDYKQITNTTTALCIFLDFLNFTICEITYVITLCVIFIYLCGLSLVSCPSTKS